MQRIWWLNSTLCAKVHLMNFDLYNYQTPRWPDCRTSKKCSGDIGLSENNSAENSSWGEGAIASSKSICTSLLATNSNFGRISYRFRDIDAFRSKIACFSHLSLV